TWTIRHTGTGWSGWDLTRPRTSIRRDSTPRMSIEPSPPFVEIGVVRTVVPLVGQFCSEESDPRLRGMDAPHLPARPVSPPGLDLDSLAGYLARSAPGILDGPFTGDVIVGGKSNLTYVVHGAGSASVVLRRPPLAHVLPTAHDMSREFRVIAALHPTGFPV